MDGCQRPGHQTPENRDYAEAFNALKNAIAGDPSGDSLALLALAHFQLEEYDLAANHYEAALKHDPDNQEWKEMLGSAKANVVAEVHVPVPDISFFDRDKLLAKPMVPEGALPSPPPHKEPGLLKRPRLAAGNVLGAIISLVMSVLTELVGKLMGYRDEVWTNWYRRRFTL